MTTVKSEFIANGQLPAAATVLWTAPLYGIWRVTLITLHNTTGGAITPTIGVAKRDGATRVISSAALAANTTRWMEPPRPGIVLEGGDTLIGFDATATSIDYCVFGEVEV